MHLGGTIVGTDPAVGGAPGRGSGPGGDGRPAWQDAVDAVAADVAATARRIRMRAVAVVVPLVAVPASIVALAGATVPVTPPPLLAPAPAVPETGIGGALCLPCLRAQLAAPRHPGSPGAGTAAADATSLPGRRPLAVSARARGLTARPARRTAAPAVAPARAVAAPVSPAPAPAPTVPPTETPVPAPPARPGGVVSALLDTAGGTVRSLVGG
jgi:hypothetical protein